jgi:hypothetical protein
VTRDYRDLVIETLVAQEADLHAEIRHLVAERDVYRAMALEALALYVRTNARLAASQIGIRRQTARASAA